jgi:hypothetical protein
MSPVFEDNGRKSVSGSTWNPVREDHMIVLPIGLDEAKLFKVGVSGLERWGI